MIESHKAVVLLSGGLDSTTTLAIAKAADFELYAMTFCYGQRHDYEIDCAKRVARTFGVADHQIVMIDLRTFGGSALTDDIDVPKGRSEVEIGEGIPVTYGPARNTIFLSYALAWAEVLGALDIFIGVNAIDYSGYPDCRDEFIEAFQRVAELGTRAGVEEGGKLDIHTPLIKLTKADIIRKGLELGVDYSLTCTCYDPDEQDRACGQCDACQLRLKGFEEAGVPDPVAYQLQAPVSA